jgi:AcrR family transcriptional regulator
MSRTSKTPLDRRNEFIQAARVLFNEKGFENTSIDDIVARVGVAKGLFYYYFDSKEKILDILFARLQDEIESAIAGAMEKKGLNAIERFNELMAAKREVACRSATLLAYFRQDRNKAVQFTMEKRALNAMAGAMEEIIRQGVQEGLFETDRPRHTAIAILSMAHGLNHQLPEDLTREDLQEHYQVIQALTERLLGMRPGTLVFSDELLPPEFGKD